METAEADADCFNMSCTLRVPGEETFSHPPCHSFVPPATPKGDCQGMGEGMPRRWLLAPSRPPPMCHQTTAKAQCPGPSMAGASLQPLPWPPDAHTPQAAPAVPQEVAYEVYHTEELQVQPPGFSGGVLSLRHLTAVQLSSGSEELGLRKRCCGVPHKVGKRAVCCTPRINTLVMSGAGKGEVSSWLWSQLHHPSLVKASAPVRVG